MGKIRIKTLGSAEEEKKEKEKVKARKEAKKSLPAGRQAVKVPGLKGGEKLPSMGPTEEELATIPVPPSEVKEETPTEARKEVKVKQAPKDRGKRYKETAKLVEKSRHYSLAEAIALVKKTSLSRFDGSVEVHISTVEKGLSGSVKLPHGTGKQTRVAIADPSAGPEQVEALLKKIESGMIDFDVLVATPAAMPLLAKFARILGPRGLMPNPKAGTITEEPEKVAEKFKAGEMRFKTEVQAPLIHLTIGKVSFPEKDLEENLKTLIGAIGPSKIQKLTLSSTMGPGIKVDLTTV